MHGIKHHMGCQWKWGRISCFFFNPMNTNAISLLLWLLTLILWSIKMGINFSLNFLINWLKIHNVTLSGWFYVQLEFFLQRKGAPQSTIEAFSSHSLTSSSSFLSWFHAVSYLLSYKWHGQKHIELCASS